MQFPDSFFEDEVRDGFYVPSMMKRAWAASLEVLDHVAKICEKHNIRWYIYFGTLLGAVRHGGFIPWDDDLDICMMRDDYIRFNEAAPKELPKEYLIKNQPSEYRMHTTIWNSDCASLEENRLKKSHGFPFMGGIDIFPFDYLAYDREDEEVRRSLAALVYHTAMHTGEDGRCSPEIKEQLSEIKSYLHMTFDKRRPIRKQLFSLAVDLFSMYTDKKHRNEVVRMHRWISDGPRPKTYPLEFFGEPVMLRFEGTDLPAPSAWKTILEVEYGDYMKPSRSGSGHGYPFYRGQEEDMIAQLKGGRIPYKYYFDASELKEKRVSPDLFVKSFTAMATKAHLEIVKSLAASSSDTAKGLLEVCQTSAIQTGTALEQLGEDSLVRILEEYCETAWQIYETLGTAQPARPRDVQSRLDCLLKRLAQRTEGPAGQRREVVFLPFKAVGWERIEPLWKEAMEDKGCDVYVIPIPYYYKNLDGTLRDMQYEAGQLPGYVPVTDYRQYDFKKRRPDTVFIQNPYDEYNLATSVPPSFFARSLKPFTKKLVYVPYFVLDEAEMADPKVSENMEYYVSTPGVVLADTTIVQSAGVRQAYIDYLAKFAGESTRDVWEKKIQYSGQRASDIR